MNHITKYVASSLLLIQALVSCGVTPQIQSASIQPPLLSSQVTLTEQQQALALIGILGGVGWLTLNSGTGKYLTGAVLQTNTKTVLTEMITDSMINGDGLDQYYVGLMNQVDLSRLAEVYLTLEGTLAGLQKAKATIGDAAGFRSRMSLVTSVVLQEKSNQKKISLSLDDLFKSLVNTGTPQPPKPGDDCFKGFEKDGRWNDPSTLKKHTEDHYADFRLADAGAASQKAYAEHARTFFQRAVQTQGKGFQMWGRPDGDIVIAERSVGVNGRFGVYTQAGGAKTIFNIDPKKTTDNYIKGDQQKNGYKPLGTDWHKGEKGKIQADGVTCK
jgi:hypothetical protein